MRFNVAKHTPHALPHYPEDSLWLPVCSHLAVERNRPLPLSCFLAHLSPNACGTRRLFSMAGTEAEEMCLQDAGSEHRHDFGQLLGAPSSRSSGDGEGSGQSLKGLFQCQNNTGHFAWCHLHSSCFGQCPELPCALFLWHRFNGRWVGGDKNRCCEKKLRRKHTMGRRGYGHSSAPEPCRALLWEAHSFGEGAVRSSSRLGPEGQEVAGLAP